MWLSIGISIRFVWLWGESGQCEAGKRQKSRIPSPESPVPRLWLQTSPEFAMKRMLAAGAGPNLSSGSRVPSSTNSALLHNPEFTLVEWYQPGDELDDRMQIDQRFVRDVAK